MARPTRKSRRASQPQTHLKSGNKVIIRRNPHHAGAEDVVGTIVRVRSGEGFGGCDLVDVRYADPRDGKNHTMPFAPSCLEASHRMSLLALAVRYEHLAAHIRRLL